jgi:hypothetical protein
MYFTKAHHFKGAIEDPKAPAQAKQMARFINVVVGTGRKGAVGEKVFSKIPCMAGPSPRTWCLGLLHVFCREAPAEIAWECPECGRAGEISEFD